jgi:hypothetical protein
VQQDVLISKVGRACRFFLLVLTFNLLGDGFAAGAAAAPALRLQRLSA